MSIENIDITDLLKDLAESLGDTTKAKIVKEAVHEIIRLRKSWEYQRKEFAKCISTIQLQKLLFFKG